MTRKLKVVKGVAEKVVRIRHATRRDAPAISALAQEIQAIHAEALPTTFKAANARTFPVVRVRALMSRAESVFLVAVAADTVVGHAYAEIQLVPDTSIRYAATHMQVHQIVTTVARRGQGIGQQLLAALEPIARERGATTMLLNVWTFNDVAHSFYAREGFADTRHVMTKMLSTHTEP